MLIFEHVLGVHPEPEALRWGVSTEEWKAPSGLERQNDAECARNARERVAEREHHTTSRLVATGYGHRAESDLIPRPPTITQVYRAIAAAEGVPEGTLTPSTPPRHLRIVR